MYMTPEQKVALEEVIWVDRDRMSGTPCFRGTRVPIQTLIDIGRAAPPLKSFWKIFQQ